jgi:hypothetical protein
VFLLNGKFPKNTKSSGAASAVSIIGALSLAADGYAWSRDNLIRVGW